MEQSNKQKITPFLWFDTNAEEAINFYTSIFKDSKIGKVVRWPKGGPGPEGSLLTGDFTLNGQVFTAINGGPQFKFNESISFVVDCGEQDEVDYYWNKLTEGGEESQCGWLKDKFGLSWQITPTILSDMLADKDQKKSQRAMKAMMQMKKLDIQKLEEAFEGKFLVAH